MRSALFLLASLALSIGCGSPKGGGTAGTGGTGGSTTSTGGSGGGTTSSTGGTVECGDDTPINEELPDATDPEAGDFTLDEALAGLPEGPGPLRAVLDTDLGVITCTFHDKEAPNGTANFIGLARGRRAWKDPMSKKWVHRAFYDGLTFHRVIPDFVAQGGDPLGNGTGGPGYKFKNEIAGLTHKVGTLAYANTGVDGTNGSQFYICEKPQPALDPDYTIFGECTPPEVVTAITHVPTGAGNKPVTPIHMKTVKITRCAP